MRKSVLNGLRSGLIARSVEARAAYARLIRGHPARTVKPVEDQ